ncbi:outer membrane protein assembly factor YaeT [Kingella potus]|uniref:Outer membrane protein assembly factor YaeT n=1 Tax=Kingella potus TaxID=265175 RepID=A0A377QZI2_9NEIS|nr:autotransporter assembly complex family protein [Kingella potus]STR00392.1 outer membrane protein assembly factor YaeT [Kingella potus]
MNKPAALVLLMSLTLPAAPALSDGLSAGQEAQRPSENTEAADKDAQPKPSLFARIKNRLLPKQTVQKKGALQPKFPVTVEAAPADVKEMLEEHLPLITQQQEEELDAEQMEFLAEEAPEQILTMLKTKGYFNGRATVSRSGGGYLVKVDSGPQTKIANVGIAILGDVLQDGNLGEYYRNASADWALPVGSVFNQDDWSSSKTSVLAAVRRKKYPLAEFSSTRAQVDPANRSADLSVTVDSGKPVYFGDFEISGTQRYPESVVRGLAQFDSGSPYDLDKLLDYQQALEQNSHYSGASVQADFDRIQGDRVPVKVSVSETKKHKLELGLSYDSEYGPGGKFGYDYYNLFGKGYTGSIVTNADKYEQTIAAGISQPRNNRGHYFTGSLSYNRKTTQKLETETWSSGIWRVRDRNGIESRIGIEYVEDKSKIPDANVNLGRSFATMITASWKKQNITTQLRPENGYYLDIKGGTTLGSLLSSSSMQRIAGSAGYYFTPENKKIGTFVTRGQIGFVNAKSDSDTPAILRFRTGGATSVRGYELDSIGRAGPSGSVLPERALAVASAEYQYPINKSFSAALFHDIGGAAHSFRDMHLKHGTGVGVRWFSPVAPFSFDIAYGHQDKKIRWHISLGTRF